MGFGSESERIEFKLSTSETKEGIVSMASILNKHGGGALYFGVRDDGKAVGQDIGKSTLRELSHAIASNISPSCWYEIARHDTGTGKSVIEVTFSGSRAPYSAYGRYYQRFADEDRKISDIELENLFKLRQQDYSLWERDDSGCTIDAIDERLLHRAVRQDSKLNYDDAFGVDAEVLLNKLGLVSKEGTTLTNAGCVLFSKEAPVLLKLAVFATSTKNTFIRLEHFEGNIFECIEKGIDFVSESIDWPVSFNGSAQRIETPEIPLEAIREAIVNAFAHGCYDSNTSFEIDVFSDRVSIYSPGAFPRGYKPEDFAFNASEPVALNPKIVDVLFRTGDIESFGTGFRRIFDTCDARGVGYRYLETKSGFRFEFMRSNGHENVRKMSATEKAVLHNIASNPYATADEIAAAIGKSKKTVYRATNVLKSLGILRREGSASNGYWIVASDTKGDQ